MKKRIVILSVLSLIVIIVFTFFVMPRRITYLKKQRDLKHHEEMVQRVKEEFQEIKNGEASFMTLDRWMEGNGVLPKEFGTTREKIEELRHKLHVRMAKEHVAEWRNGDFDYIERSIAEFFESGLVSFEEAGTSDEKVKEFLHLKDVQHASYLLHYARNGYVGYAADLRFYLESKKKVSYKELKTTPKELTKLVHTSKVTRARYLVGGCRKRDCTKTDVLALKLLVFNEGVSYDEAGITIAELDSF